MYFEGLFDTLHHLSWASQCYLLSQCILLLHCTIVKIDVKKGTCQRERIVSLASKTNKGIIN